MLRDAKAGDQQKNLQRLQASCADLEARAAAESLTLKGADGLMKEIKLAIGTMGPLPSKQDRDDSPSACRPCGRRLAPRIQEMREAEEWKRWANVQVQEDLCTKMEALVGIAEAEPEKAANEMRVLQERWKPVAAAPRSQASALWTRFKAAQDQVYEKCKDFFAQQNAERRREPEEEDGARRARRGAPGLDRLGEGRRRDQAAAGRVEGDWPGDARATSGPAGSASAPPATSSSLVARTT